MKLEGKGKLLKIFIGESDKWNHEALYHAIIKKIKENGLAGATTVRGIEGFGANSRVHTKAIEVLSQDLPIVIEVIDKEEKINEMYTNPDNFKGRTVTITGKIFTPLSYSDDKIAFQIYGDPDNFDRNTIIYADSSVSAKKDDYVRITGTVDGEYTGSNIVGGTLYVPKITAAKVEIVSYVDAVSPAIATIASGSSINQYGYIITIDKIEFAQNETRVYVTVKNSGSASFDLFNYSSKILQNGNQYEYQTNYYADYPEIPSEILPGATASGILAFPKIEQAEMQIYLTGYSENYNEHLDDYVFKISSQ